MSSELAQEYGHVLLDTANTLPVFGGSSFEEHVEVWRTVDESMQNHLWTLGAIAHSLEKKHGEDSMGTFASQVGCSKRWVNKLAQTYRTWEDGNPVSQMSFKHHAIAALDGEPEKVLNMAHDNEWSTRELEAVVKERNGSAVIEEEAHDQNETMVICPHCNGKGIVPSSNGVSA